MCHITNLDQMMPQVQKHNIYIYPGTRIDCFTHILQLPLCEVMASQDHFQTRQTLLRQIKEIQNSKLFHQCIIQFQVTGSSHLHMMSLVERENYKMTSRPADRWSSNTIYQQQYHTPTSGGHGSRKLNNSKVSKPLSLAAQLFSGGISSWSRWFEWGWSPAMDATGPCGVWFQLVKNVCIVNSESKRRGEMRGGKRERERERERESERERENERVRSDKKEWETE